MYSKTKKMNNPFPRPQAGAYKPYLVESLNKIGRTTESNYFSNGNLKLAVISSLTGGVILLQNLNEVCVNALNELEPNDTIRHYIWGLLNGQFVVASSNNVFVYDPTDVKSVEYVKEQLTSTIKEIIQPYFTN